MNALAFQLALARGQQAIAQKRLARAAVWFRQAVSQNPEHPQALACLGQSLCWLGRRIEGLAYLRQAGRMLAQKPKTGYRPLLELIRQFQFWEDYPSALELSKLAVRLNRHDASAFQLLATCYLRLNFTAEALAAAEKAVRLSPDPLLQVLLASAEADHGRYPAAKQRLQQTLARFLNATQEFHARKELARVLDRLGELEEAFAQLRAAERLAGSLPEVKAQPRDFVFKLLDGYAGVERALFERFASFPIEDNVPAPVFLLGFFRSGTTLTQAVLSAHPQVAVLDENDLISKLRVELERLSSTRGTVLDQLCALDDRGFKHLRAYYWALAKWRFGEGIFKQTVIVDKTTFNTLDLALINCVFPDSKVIFMRRDPRDVCLSCYFQLITPNPSTVHLLGWESTARLYTRVMQWWQTTRPKLTLKHIEIGYEDAVLDFERTYRALFDFLGLPWDPQVANFYRLARGKAIATPSAKQVSKPLYASSIGRWRAYAFAFEPVLDILRPFL